MEHLPNHMQNLQCDYCGIDISKGSWDSSWHGEKHYKTCSCSGCGRENRFTVEFTGSGHDRYVQEGFSELEASVRRVQEG